ncbi:aminodeoxychorismate synthase component I [Tahibacter amnicola]|uniref:Aminodeoxychorismate synthase component I n=1 Tax=Tahibacter amnicola TaxID=2976241 RepID=A0ABY6BKX1_9GAMM|nr:aminodeoxychorismate synthase component I [Tahibacter amnicola]UXI70654.1 aminodeoxychorismate synthase component I [Tahibacter amnicola]
MDTGLTANPVVRVLDGTRDLLSLAGSDQARYPCLFESVAYGTHQSRWDILLAFPQDALSQPFGGRVTDAEGNDHGTDFLAALDRLWQSLRTSPVSAELPFRGGWGVYLAYEMAQQVEPVLQLPPAPEAVMPVACAVRCPAAVLVDHHERRTYLVAEPAFAALLDALERDVECALPVAQAPVHAQSIEEDAPQRYTDGVARVIDYLIAGDVFQVNLSREWRAWIDPTASTAGLYAQLRRTNPSPFAGLFQQPEWAVLSSSPERLVETRGDRVQTRPIAGTRPRFPGDDDAARIRELIGHPKERAEHIMLIDLERNDLGRIARAGTVEVNELMTVETYSHVHHIVSNVRARLVDGTTPGAVIRAVFPGGTITGCPKVRCMQIIAELEQQGRGAYTGSMGYLNRDGDMDLNILIRTMTRVGSTVRFRAGAGIVVDSIADKELDESRAKARGMLRALGADS